MSEKSYTVGDILFVIGRKNSVFPVKVVEEILKRTLQGVQKTYNVQLDPNSDPVNLSNLEGITFTSLLDLQCYMEDNAKSAVDKIVLKVAQDAEAIFGQQLESLEPVQTLEPEEVEEEETRVILPDGSIAKVKGVKSILL
jgi:hypothetical protein